MTLILEFPKTVEDRLAAKARAAGVDVPTYATRLLERDASRPTLAEISGKVAQNFQNSGMTEDQLSEHLEQEKHEARAERTGKTFSE